jgi:hypothetical protein
LLDLPPVANGGRRERDNVDVVLEQPADHPEQEGADAGADVRQRRDVDGDAHQRRAAA